MAALLGVAVLLTFAGAVRCGFLLLDDPDYLIENQQIRSLDYDALRWAFTTFRTGNWHPVTWLAHMAAFRTFGTDAAAQHAVDVTLHATSTVLLFLVLERATGALWRSVFAAALFGLHPVQVEPVVWISSRKDLLAALFGIASLGAWVRHTRTGGGFAYGSALAFYALALMSKPTVVPLPLALLLLDAWPLERLARVAPRRLIVEKIPFFACAAAAATLTLLAQAGAGSIRTLTDLGLAARTENALVAVARYLGKVVWPADLAILYPHPGSWPIRTVVASAALLVGGTALVWRERRRRPYLLVGWIWFLLFLVPTIGLVQVGRQAMADRYLHLPLVGLAIAAVWGTGSLVRGSAARQTLAALGSVVITAAALRSAAYVPYWRDSETIFAHALTATSGNAFAHHHLGFALAQRGEHERALEHYAEALRLSPADARVHYDAGALLLHLNRLEPALRHLERAAELDPGRAEYHFRLGRALHTRGDLEAASKRYARALELEPNFARAWHSLGVVRARVGDLTSAMNYFRRALTIDPRDAAAHDDLARALQLSGREADAVEHYRAALRTDPERLRPLRQLARLYGGTNPALRDERVAIDLARRAAAASHGAVDDLRLVARLQASLGRFEDAADTLEAALRTPTLAANSVLAIQLEAELEAYRRNQLLPEEPALLDAPTKTPAGR